MRDWRRLAALLVAVRCVSCGYLLAAPRDEAAHKLQKTEHLHAARVNAQEAAAARIREARMWAGAIALKQNEAAAKLRDIEAATAQAANRLREASDAQQRAAKQISQREAAIAAMLPVVLRLSRYPVETLLAAPAPPAQAIEGVLAVQGLIAELATEIRALRTDQAEQAARSRDIADRQAALEAARARQTQAEAALDRDLSRTRATETAAESEQEEAARQAAALAAQAATLRDAITAMDLAERARQQNAPKNAVGPGFSQAAGRAPVAGAILRRYGAPAEDGPATGITFAAAAGAVVNSPCTGKIAFAAPFRSYGRLMIVECGKGYDFVLAGLDRLDAPVGRTIHRGDPIGRMPTGGAKSPGLYLELRLNGRPVDPAPFLNAKA
jgi:septal ring factor EnvC (AmiA/AmiB activator)